MRRRLKAFLRSASAGVDLGGFKATGHRPRRPRTVHEAMGHDFHQAGDDLRLAMQRMDSELAVR